MNSTLLRFLLYALVGLLFGVCDWFYLDWLAYVQWGSLGESRLVVPIILVLNFGIWLVPVVPIVLYEARQARKVISPMLAGSLAWECAMLSYYAFYALLLSLGKLPNLEGLSLLEGGKDARFWEEYWQMFDRIILDQFLEWSVIAVVGGALLGALAFVWARRRQPTQR